MGVLKTNFLTPWGGTNAILSISLDLVCCIDRSMAPPVQLYVLHILFFLTYSNNANRKWNPFRHEIGSWPMLLLKLFIRFWPHYSKAEIKSFGLSFRTMIPGNTVNGLLYYKVLLLGACEPKQQIVNDSRIQVIASKLFQSSQCLCRRGLFQVPS